MPQQIPADERFLALGDEPHLVGRRCASCGTYVFPLAPVTCPNPACDGTEFTEVPLCTTGRVWSYTDARYQPPAPYVAADPYSPFAIAAVELADEGLVVLGQVAAGFTVDDLEVGAEVALVVEPLYREPDGTERMTWRWQPVDRQPSGQPGAVPVLEATE
jgi:hypothetical protein